MVLKEVTIINAAGLHARPAASLVKLASQFSSKVRLHKDGLEVNAKSIMGVLTLAVEKGSTIKIIADGNDEQNALDNIINLINNRFGEEEQQEDL